MFTRTSDTDVPRLGAKLWTPAWEGIELRSNSISNLTQKLLLTRYKQGLSTDKVTGFNNVIRLYSIRATIGKYNTIQLRDLLQLVVAIKLVNTSIGTRKVTPNQCDTIENLALYIGAKVILIQNIQVKLGLVNSTTSIVKDIIQKGHADIKRISLSYYQLRQIGITDLPYLLSRIVKRSSLYFLYFISRRV